MYQLQTVEITRFLFTFFLILAKGLQFLVDMGQQVHASTKRQSRVVSYKNIQESVTQV